MRSCYYCGMCSDDITEDHLSTRICPSCNSLLKNFGNTTLSRLYKLLTYVNKPPKWSLSELKLLDYSLRTKVLEDYPIAAHILRHVHKHMDLCLEDLPIRHTYKDYYNLTEYLLSIDRYSISKNKRDQYVRFLTKMGDYYTVKNLRNKDTKVFPLKYLELVVS